MSTRVEDQLAAAKADNTFEHLLRCARRVNENTLERLRAQLGWAALRPAHMALFPHIDVAGTRITAIAARMGVSKQAVAPLVDELVAHGALVKVRDPADGRARLVQFRTDGPYSIFAGLQALAAYEAELGARMGAADWAALKRGLKALTAALDAG